MAEESIASRKLMMLKSVDIRGLRGFATDGHLDIAVPTGSRGSGLTVLVGPNNAGKSTVIEALRALSYPLNVTFAQGRRNQRAGDIVSLKLTRESGQVHEIRSPRSGASQTETQPPYSVDGRDDVHWFWVLPSRRAFNPFFHRTPPQNRIWYVESNQLQGTRETSLDRFTNRLFRVEAELERRARFDELLTRVLAAPMDWSIDQHDGGQFFLRVKSRAADHSSEGLGEGIISLFFIVEALSDSREGDTLVIDEPELSLHPAYQRRLYGLFSELSATRQIILATHSPYFVDWTSIGEGANIARVHQDDTGTRIAQASRETLGQIVKLLRDRSNVHLLGLDSREVFFLEDGVILVEGQEDVVGYQLIAEQLHLEVRGSFYGWGVGGAPNMKMFAQLLKELGFVRVIGILDGDMVERARELSKAFPDYKFKTISTKDVRTKIERQIKAAEGLLDDHWKLRPEHECEARKLLTEVNEFLLPPVSQI